MKTSEIIPPCYTAPEQRSQTFGYEVNLSGVDTEAPTS